MKKAERETIYTEAELRKRVKYWQERLRLQDWRIIVQIVRARDMEHDDEVGALCQWNLYNKIARISILDPADHIDWVAQDMEWVLVHEMLHLHIAAIDPEGTEEKSMAVEQAIESMTYGYMRLERGI